MCDMAFAHWICSKKVSWTCFVAPQPTLDPAIQPHSPDTSLARATPLFHPRLLAAPSSPPPRLRLLTMLAGGSVRYTTRSWRESWSWPPLRPSRRWNQWHGRRREQAEESQKSSGAVSPAREAVERRGEGKWRGQEGRFGGGGRKGM